MTLRQGSFEQALNIANQWLAEIKKAYPEVVMTTNEQPMEGFPWKAWSFIFTHKITNAQCVLDTHGLTEEQLRGAAPTPVIFWNGNSFAEPSPDDWLPDNDEWGYKVVYTKPLLNVKP